MKPSQAAWGLIGSNSPGALTTSMISNSITATLSSSPHPYLYLFNSYKIIHNSLHALLNAQPEPMDY
jgi:hypothetical protein